MIKVLCIEARQLTPVGYWRVFKPFETINRLFPGVFQFDFKSKDLDYADISGADVVFMTRPHKAETFEWIREAKQTKGIPFILDMDDDLLDVPREHPLFPDLKKRRKILENHMKIADLLWYSTDFLLKKYGKGVHIPNAIDTALLPVEPAPDAKRVMWRGNSIQMHDLWGAGMQMFDEIQDYANQFGFIGFLPPFFDYANPIHEHDGGPIMSYDPIATKGRTSCTVIRYPVIDNTSMYLQQLKFDRWNYIWKPLIDHDFNRAKSNISMMDAAISGGVCLTNFAGQPQWENATGKILPYDAACDLWAKSCADIRLNYDITTAANIRASWLIKLAGRENLFAQ